MLDKVTTSMTHNHQQVMKKLTILTIVAAIIGCSSKQQSPSLPDRAAFQDTINGKPTDLYFLSNPNGLRAAITNYGGRIVSLLVPDNHGRPTNIIIGFDDLEGYRHSTEPYFGATIGRYGNRIAGGKFALNGISYQLSVNNGPNTLHGGKGGFQGRVWEAKQLGDSSLELSYVAKDGEEGFPGNTYVKVTYTLTSKNELKCAYEAMTDQATIVNLTNHAFFNLNGEDSGPITDHYLQINARHYTPVDSTLIPSGELATVSGTPFNFTTAKPIGRDINTTDTQLLYGKGYDHNFVLTGSGMREAAIALGDRSGIRMRIFTEEPGLQFYSGNFMQGKNKLRKGPDAFRTAFCLETQHFPDSPNQPAFPSTTLQRGDLYHTVSIYKFEVEPLRTK
jgi:aldose 1-epimerase